jgi:hypothetical protein
MAGRRSANTAAAVGLFTAGLNHSWISSVNNASGAGRGRKLPPCFPMKKVAPSHRRACINFIGATFNAGRKRIGKKRHLCRKRPPPQPASHQHRHENQFWPQLRHRARFAGQIPKTSNSTIQQIYEHHSTHPPESPIQRQSRQKF